ncbi:hypothetical protein [Sphingomonas trueperi]|uniref:hypothetical protein n=1 Tax=Sphingomonas trueperi TaxID=53317 RepID=UPI001C7DD96E
MMQDTFTVRAPDGSEYRVQAPAGATEQDILARVQAEHDAAPQRMSAEDEADYIKLAQDPHATAGQLVDYVASKGFNLDRRTADEFIEQREAAGGQAGSRVSYLDAQPSQAAPESLRAAPAAPEEHNSLREDIRAAAGRIADGALPGAASTIRGLRGAIDNAWDWAVHGKPLEPGKAFDEYSDDMKKVTKRFSDEHPDLGDGLGWAGFGASFLAPELRVARGAGLGSHAVNGLATGAAYGTAGGLLNDSGEGRLANAGNGLMFGGAVGAAAPALLRGGAAAGSYALRTVPFADRAVEAIGDAASRVRGLPVPPPNRAARAQAERLIGTEMRNGNLAQGMGATGAAATPASVEAEVARRQALGTPAMPADTTEDLRRLTSWALQGRGPMTTRARAALSARQAQQGTRIRQHVQDELGQAVDPIQAAEDINARAAAASGPGYQRAYAQPMVLTPEIESIMRTPAFRNALPQAVENIQNAQRNPTELGFRLHPDGSIEGANTLSVEGFDQVIRAMRDSATAAMDTSGFRPRNTTNSVHINARRQDLQRLIGEQNEPYRDVVANYADEMAIRDALGQGQEVAKLTGPEIAGQMADMPDHAQEAWMTGARTALADSATEGGLKPTANVAQRIRQQVGLSGGGSYAAPGDAAKLQATETMSGRPGVMNRLDDRLEAEDQAYKTFSETFGNSKTYGRQAYDEAINGGDAKVAAKFLTGRAIGATMDLLFRGRGAGRFKQAVQERVAEVLTAANPADVTEAMAAIQRRAETDRAFNASLQRAGIKLGQLTALQAAGMPTAADPVPPAAIPGYR